VGFFFGRKSKSVSPNATFRLTEQGREKLQEFTGDAKSQILVALETRGTSDIDEIAETAGLSRGQVERIIVKMVRGGYVQCVSTAMGEEE